jgi:CDP-diacylglycerol--glycerol-3-phosphate 3-phosphatidyltransferase
VLWATLTFVAAIGTALIPYIRARAEAAGIECKSGLLERPERTMLLIIGLWFGVLRAVILLLAVLTHVTAVQRILAVRRSTRQ